MIIYLIRSKKTGLFSTGGRFFQWSKTGKVWTQRGSLANHFALLGQRQLQAYAEADAEVIQYILTEEGCAVSDVAEWLDASAARKAEREAARQQRRDTFEQERRRKQYEQLRAEFAGQ
jgi:hypothetical protein